MIPRSRGFTLVELLVVISVVAILIGLLLPALKGARDSARSVMCVSRLRTLSMGVSRYAEDHGELPRSKHSVGFSGVLPWGPQVFPHTTGLDFGGESDLWQDDSWWSALNEHYRCPHDRREAPARQPGFPFGQPVYSYGVNVYFELGLDEIDPEKHMGDPFSPFRTIARIPRPSSTIALSDLPDSIGVDHVMAHFWRTRGLDPGEGVGVSRHGDDAGYVFLDGHARSTVFTDVYDPSRGLDQWDPRVAR